MLVSMQRRTPVRKSAVKAHRSVRGRPPAREVATRTERLLDVATKVFLEKGFQGASMIEIARRAGASKQTLYARYPSKAALFAALVQRKAAHLFEAIGPLGEGRNLHDTLLHCASELLDLILSEDARGVHRVVIAECMEFPELSRLFWENGPGRVRAMLTDYFREQHKLGNMQCSNPDDAVEAFFGLLVGSANLRSNLGLPTPLMSPTARKAWVRYVVDFFLASSKAEE